MTYRSSSSDTAGLGIILFFVAFWLIAGIGWVWNIVKLISLLNAPLTGMEIARIVGVFAAPLGAVLGFL